jgi:serine/threonine-protein kinase
VLGTTIGSPYYMAPEQAQGLDTLDARADVFALGAITYECMTGSVPFTGNNGPSILLAILTKDPDPPSTKSAGAKYPIPAAMDDVIEMALAKNQNIRTKSVGELATMVGHAYGLQGDHRKWAQTDQAELAHLISEARKNAPAPVARPPAALEAAADPFAQPDPFAVPAGTGTNPMQGAPGRPGAGGTHPIPQSPPSQPMQPMQPTNFANDDLPMGVPASGGRPPWLIPVIVGVAALVLGGGLVMALAR